MGEMELFSRILGKHLRLQRNMKELTLEKLAERTNIDDKHLGKIERGEKMPSSYTLFKLYNGLDIKVDVLFHKIQKDMDDYHHESDEY